MTDYTDYSYSRLKIDIDITLDRLRMSDFAWDDNEAAIYLFGTKMFFREFMICSQKYCQDNNLVFDDDFIQQHISDYQFFLKIFNKYKDSYFGNESKINFIDCCFMKKNPEVAYFWIANLIKRKLKPLVPVSGVVMSLQPNGAGIVKLDDGRNAYFDRLSVMATATRKHGKLRNGSRIRANIDEKNEDIVRLIDVQPVRKKGLLERLRIDNLFHRKLEFKVAKNSKNDDGFFEEYEK